MGVPLHKRKLGSREGILVSVKPPSRVRDSAFISQLVSKQTSTVMQDQGEGAFQNTGSWQGSVK